MKKTILNKHNLFQHWLNKFILKKYICKTLKYLLFCSIMVMIGTVFGVPYRFILSIINNLTIYIYTLKTTNIIIYLFILTSSRLMLNNIKFITQFKCNSLLIINCRAYFCSNSFSILLISRFLSKSHMMNILMMIVANTNTKNIKI